MNQNENTKPPQVGQSELTDGLGCTQPTPDLSDEAITLHMLKAGIYTQINPSHAITQPFYIDLKIVFRAGMVCALNEIRG